VVAAAVVSLVFSAATRALAGPRQEEHETTLATWTGKHNDRIPLCMPHLMLDLPVMRASTVYNWRERPILTGGKDGLQQSARSTLPYLHKCTKLFHLGKPDNGMHMI